MLSRYSLPPIPGAPWFRPRTEEVFPKGAPAPAPAAAANQPFLEAPCPPSARDLPFAPWNRFRHQAEEAFPFVRFVYPGGPSGAKLTLGLLPFLSRVPGESPERRLTRFTEKVSDLVNSLWAQGVIVQTGPKAYSLRAQAGAGGGITGTFGDLT